MTRSMLVMLLMMGSMDALPQTATVMSPNQDVLIGLFNRQGTDQGEWYLRLDYTSGTRSSKGVLQVRLGLKRDDQDFSGELRYLNKSRPALIHEAYAVLHGKRSHCVNTANEMVVTFENARKSRMNLVLRAYNDGLAFRYEFPEKEGRGVVLDEATSYEIPHNARRWLEKWNPANEELYSVMDNDSVQQDWSYPALFCTADTTCWYLIHEADINRSYCGSKLSNVIERSAYKVTLPDPTEASDFGPATPTITFPWKSPWRIIIVGGLSDIVQSTLTEDVSSPSKIENTDWIRPGAVSWNYWSDNHGTKDYKVVCEFADLAASMNWSYTLLDWEWDVMGNGGTLPDAVRYILSEGVKPLLWYNSGVNPWIRATPRDRLRTHESRVAEFSKLREMGVAGIKVDFFLTEKQEMITYYLDILEDAAQYQLMVNFHGCMVPRGWSRTYPHLMTQEGVRGAEWYNNGPEFTPTAPQHNTILPFTRNVVGPMDYTPVTFTNSQYPHTTSYGHELALSVVFESGLQHFADRPYGYASLPDAARSLLKSVPTAWDDTKLLDGFPGRDIIVVRQKGDAWYIGGLNAEQREKTKTLVFTFLPEHGRYRMTLIADGEHDRDLFVRYLVVDRSSAVDVALLRRGGFAARLTPLPMEKP